MNKTESHQFVMQTLQDYLNTLPVSSRIAMKDKLEVAMAALAPVVDKAAEKVEPPNAG